MIRITALHLVYGGFHKTAAELRCCSRLPGPLKAGLIPTWLCIKKKSLLHPLFEAPRSQLFASLRHCLCAVRYIPKEDGLASLLHRELWFHNSGLLPYENGQILQQHSSDMCLSREPRIVTQHPIPAAPFSKLNAHRNKSLEEDLVETLEEEWPGDTPGRKLDTSMRVIGSAPTVSVRTFLCTRHALELF